MPQTLSPFILHCVRPYKGAAFVFVLMAIAAGFWGPVNAFLLKQIVDAAKHAPLKDSSLIVWPSVLIVVNFIVLDNFTWRGIGLLNRWYQPLIKNNILSDTFAYLTHAPFRFFQNKLSGRLSNQVTLLADQIESILEVHVPHFLRGAFLFMAALLGLLSVDVRFFVVMTIWFVVFFVLSLLMSQKLVHFSDKHAARESQTAGQLVDGLSNIHNVRLFANSQYEVKRLSRYLGKAKRAYRQVRGYAFWLYALQGGLIALMLAGMLFYLITLYQQGQVSIGDFVLVMGLSVDVGHMLWFTMGQVDAFNLAKGKCKQSLKALYVPCEMKDKAGATPIDITKGVIAVQNVSFAYQGVDTVFDGLNVVIPSRQKVGLVGFSGAGKSTFVHLLLRFFDVCSGSILIDSQDIAQATKDSLRNQVSLIPQDTTLFHRTIMDNIRYSCVDSSDASVIAAAKKANAHDFIMSLPQGYQSFVGERGVKLSGGQRQRIAIARAMLRQAPILILDEATSSLDSITEHHIQESLQTLMQKQTTLVIAHRLSTLQAMDRILVFDQGKIIEDGPHDALLQQGGHYAKMWQMQAGGFMPTHQKLVSPRAPQCLQVCGASFKVEAIA